MTINIHSGANLIATNPLTLRRNRKGKLYFIYNCRSYGTDLKYPKRTELAEISLLRNKSAGKILLISLFKFLREEVESWINNNKYPPIRIYTSLSGGGLHLNSAEIASYVAEALLLGEIFKND